MTVLDLQRGVIYGPIASRRLGRSLGVNLSPVKVKVCSFDCVYCHYGPTAVKARSLGEFAGRLPSPAGVAEELRRRLGRLEPPPAYITFSGNGEPTLHPEFGEVVAAVRATRDELCPAAKLAVLSNATAAAEPAVARALARLELRIMKLDAGDDATFGEINSPAAGVDFDYVVEGLKRLDDIVVQSCFVGGDVTNASDAAVNDYVRAVAAIRPTAVQIYTIDRPVAYKGLSKVPRERLAAIACRVREEAAVPAETF